MCATVPTISGAARAKLLWSGSLTKGQSTTIEGLSRYDRFLAKTSGSAATLVLTRQSSAEGELNDNMAGFVNWPGTTAACTCRRSRRVARGITSPSSAR